MYKDQQTNIVQDSILVEEEDEMPYHPLPPLDKQNEDHIQNDTGTYIKSEFGWIFLRSNDILPGLAKNNYEEVVNSNIQNLAMSEKGVKGRVTLNMLEDEPYAPVKNRSLDELVDQESNEGIKEQNVKGGRKPLLFCCSSLLILILFFILNHLIQALQYVEISIGMGIAWITTVHDLVNGLDIFNINFTAELYIVSVIT
mmetsp:Transcript_6029/g.5192  ORF Transcript_6029/g.5192 Transcript_6029/m.5192 type:complete len:199 (+) Transcript_6029:13-609(+)